MHGGRTQGSPLQESFNALQREKNPKNFYRGLLDLARDLESENRPDLAFQFYEAIKENAPTGKLKEEAKKLQGGLNGAGDRFAQWENFIRRIPAEGLDGVTIGSMFGGILAFKGTRLFALRKFRKAEPILKMLGGKGVTALASGAGLLAEGPTFAALGLGGNYALGRDVPTSWSAFREGTLRAYAMLGPLKVGGHGGKRIFDKWFRVHPVTQELGHLNNFAKFTRVVNQQTWMFGGILTGQEVEGWMGFEKPEERIFAGLKTLIHFNVAGLAARPLFAPFRPMERALELEFHQFSQSHDPVYLQAMRALAGPAGPQPAFAGMGTEIFSKSNGRVFEKNSPPLTTWLGLGAKEGKADPIGEAFRARLLLLRAQAGETSLQEVQTAVGRTLDHWRNSNQPLDPYEPEFAVMTKVLFGKSLSPNALARRFSTPSLKAEAYPFLDQHGLNFHVALSRHGNPLASFDVRLVLKEIFLEGKPQIGWVAVRTVNRLPQKFHHQGYWTMMTMHLFEWARSGNFLALEAESSSDSGRISMMDIFDFSNPRDLEGMKEGFRNLALFRFNFNRKDLEEKLDRIQHPWNFQNLVDNNQRPAGEKFIREFSDPWSGILPVKNPPREQLMRLLRRSFDVKKIWRLDPQFPEPPQISQGGRPGPEDLLEYYLDYAAKRYLSSIRRMQEHLDEFHPPRGSNLERVWWRNNFYSENIQPLEMELEELRLKVLEIPLGRERTGGAKTDSRGDDADRLGTLEELRKGLLHLKIPVRLRTAELEVSSRYHHLQKILEVYREDLNPFLDGEENQGLQNLVRRLHHWHNKLQADSRILGRLAPESRHISQWEKETTERTSALSDKIASRILEALNLGALPPLVMSQRFGQIIFHSIYKNFQSKVPFRTAVLSLGKTLGEIYQESPWDFSRATELAPHDLLWGVDSKNGNGIPMDWNGVHQLNQIHRNLKGLKFFLTPHLPLFLVKGSHFKARLKDAQGENTDFILLVEAARREAEGGIAFSILSAENAKRLASGRRKPLWQVVANIDPEGEVTITDTQRPRGPRESPFAGLDPIEGLKYIVLRWRYHPYPQYPQEKNRHEFQVSPQKENFWAELIDAMNRLEFTPARKLQPLFTPDSPGETALKEMAENEIFRMADAGEL